MGSREAWSEMEEKLENRLTNDQINLNASALTPLE